MSREQLTMSEAIERAYGFQASAERQKEFRPAEQAVHADAGARKRQAEQRSLERMMVRARAGVEYL